MPARPSDFIARLQIAQAIAGMMVLLLAAFNAWQTIRLDAAIAQLELRIERRIEQQIREHEATERFKSAALHTED